MAEHLIVVQAVEGSSPFIHPTKSDASRPHPEPDFLRSQAIAGA